MRPADEDKEETKGEESEKEKEKDKDKEKEGGEGPAEVKRMIQRRRAQPLTPRALRKDSSPLASLDPPKVRKLAKEICLQRSIDILASPEHFKFIGTCVREILEGNSEGNEGRTWAHAGSITKGDANVVVVKRSQLGKTKYPYVNKGVVFYRTTTIFT
jgi:hypothetical protein